MILTPTPLQKPAAAAGLARTWRPAPASPGHAAPRAVLQPLRVPQQLSLDLQPRLR